MFLLVCVANVLAADQVKWSYRVTGDNTPTPSLEITAVIAPGFHLYAQDNPDGGGVPLSFHVTTEGCKAQGGFKADKAYTKAYDDIMMVDEHYYTGTVKFTQKLKAASDKWTAKVEIGGQYCNDSGCYRVNELHSFSGTAPLTEAVKEEAKKVEEEKKEAKDSVVNALTEMTDSLQASEGFMEPAANLSGVSADKWWANCEAEIRAFSDNPGQQSRSLWYIFIAGFIGGLIALVTPCVWPMIPMTVSFFLKSNKSRAKSIQTAVVYGLSIIVIYVALGLIVTGLFGASALNELATSAGFNIAFFVLLVIFAISFMGGFELTLPAKWSNKMDAKVDTTTGYISIFFMAFTLCLVSFSCTGPIIGTLLVEAAATSNFISPAVGMAGFAIALALPFSLFAMFPTMLKSIPKSGGWMNTVKVVLGFLELALALKFLSVADLAYGWRLMDREVFIALWIVIFALLGVYLLGKITPRQDPAPRRQAREDRRDAFHARPRFAGVRCLHDPRPLGRTAQEHQRVRASNIHPGLQPLHGRRPRPGQRLRGGHAARRQAPQAGARRLLGLRLRQLPQDGGRRADQPGDQAYGRQRLRDGHPDGRRQEAPAPAHNGQGEGRPGAHAAHLRRQVELPAAHQVRRQRAALLRNPQR